MSLFNIASITRKIIAGIVAIIALILVAKIVISITEKLSETLVLRSSQETRGFGDLPSLPLKQLDGAKDVKQRFRIETKTGKLPSFPTVLNVYRLKKTQVDLSSETFAKNVASVFGFKKDPTKLSSVQWLWEEGSKSLEFNIQTRHFTYKNKAPKIDEESPFLEENSQILIVLFSQLGYNLPDSLQFTFTYLNKTENGWTRTISKTANWVRVDAINKFAYSKGEEGDVVSPTYLPSLVYVIIPNRSKANLDNVSEMAMNLWEIETDTVQTYNSISANDAYLRLQEGNGALVYAWTPTKDGSPDISKATDIRITDVKIGYFLSYSNLLYAQPIYIFYGAHGEGSERINFVYYVPALY